MRGVQECEKYGSRRLQWLHFLFEGFICSVFVIAADFVVVFFGSCRATLYIHDDFLRG
jgi:hypothetical protein